METNTKLALSGIVTIAGEGLVAATHSGFVGFTVALAAGVIAYNAVGDIERATGRDLPSLPVAKLPTSAVGRAAYRLLNGRSTRGGELPDDEEVEAYLQGLNMDEDIDLETDIQTFKQLLEAGVIQAALDRGEICLGYVGGKLQFIEFKHIASCGIGGTPGFGKSTTVRFILFQMAMLNARLIMVDPHIGDEEESLAAMFQSFTRIHALPPCGKDPRDVIKRVRKLAREYELRQEKGIKGPILIFVIDELNELMRRLPNEVKNELVDLLLDLEQGGRKFGIFTMLIGQRWAEQDLGGKPYGASIRSSLTSTMAHRFLEVDQAKKLIGPDDGKKCLSLTHGHYLFRINGQVTEIYTPNTLAIDAKLVQVIINKRRETTSAKPDKSVVSQDETTSKNGAPETTSGTGNRAGAEGVSSAAETTSETTKIHTLAVRVIAMQAEGISKPDIMRQLWNVTPGGGPEYEKVKLEYQKVMAYIAEKLGA